MKYKFKCKKCEKIAEYSLTIKDYDTFKAKCDKCGSDMIRIYEAPRFSVCCSGVNSDQSSDRQSSCSSCSSCSGGCSGCTGNH